MKLLKENTNKNLSKYDIPIKLYRALPSKVYHATTKDNFNSIVKNGLKDAWIGCDIDECMTYVTHNHDVEDEDVVVFEIPKKMLVCDNCDFTADVGDGWSDDWTYTFIYNGIIDVIELDCYWVDDCTWYHVKNVLIESANHPFPDSKVKQVVYHTSNKDFDKFDSRKKGSNTGWVDTNIGYFFSNNKEITKQFGSITNSYYINVRKPLDLRIWRRISYDATFENLNAEEKQVIIDLIRSQGVEPNEEYIQSIIDAACDFDAQSEIREQLAHKESMRNLRKLGYDCIIDTMDSSIGAVEYIVFNSNQIVKI